MRTRRKLAVLLAALLGCNAPSSSDGSSGAADGKNALSRKGHEVSVDDSKDGVKVIVSSSNEALQSRLTSVICEQLNASRNVKAVDVREVWRLRVTIECLTPPVGSSTRQLVLHVALDGMQGDGTLMPSAESIICEDVVCDEDGVVQACAAFVSDVDAFDARLRKELREMSRAEGSSSFHIDFV